MNKTRICCILAAVFLLAAVGIGIWMLADAGAAAKREVPLYSGKNLLSREDIAKFEKVGVTSPGVNLLALDKMEEFTEKADIEKARELAASMKLYAAHAFPEGWPSHEIFAGSLVLANDNWHHCTIFIFDTQEQNDKSSEYYDKPIVWVTMSLLDAATGEKLEFTSEYQPFISPTVYGAFGFNYFFCYMDRADYDELCALILK